MRRGHTLVEALCALALGGILASAAGLTLSSARAALERAETREVGGRAEREAASIVAKALASGAQIVQLGDTAVELDVLIGSAVLCATELRALVLPSPRSSTGSLTAVASFPAADDIVEVRQFGVTGGGAWWSATVDSAVERKSALQCQAEDGWRVPGDDEALLRLVVADSVPPELEPGAEVRVLRRGRFALYHAGKGEWVLGWRRCHPYGGACGTIQPVAGPLRPPSAGGFRVRWSEGSAGWTVQSLGVGGRGASAEVPR
jgi:type II secretory pathway pseudopilin PulG